MRGYRFAIAGLLAWGLILGSDLAAGRSAENTDDSVGRSESAYLAPPMERRPLQPGLNLDDPEIPGVRQLPAGPPEDSGVATVTPASQLETEQFNNACRPPEPRESVAPKTLDSLRTQVGPLFRVARRGPFLIASDIGPEEFSTLVDGVLACCRDCLEQDYFKTPLTQVVTIYVFKNLDTYTQGLQKFFAMAPISPYGHYGHRHGYIVVNYDTGPGTLVHELTHALMAPDFPEAPIWISEGMASLYEQCRVEGNSLKGEPNWRLPELKDALTASRMVSLAQLLPMKTGDFRAKNESLNYATSRYFCKYMEERGKLRQVYSLFRTLKAADPTGRLFIEQAFGQDLEVIEADFHQWLATQQWR